MKVASARRAAAEWVARHAARREGFRGAYFSGSTVNMPDESELPPASDVDVMLVTEHAEPPLKLGKFLYGGALIEASYIPLPQLSTAEEVLSNYHLAGGFRRNTIIADPTGHLAQLQAQVARRFTEPIWVRRRYENAMRKIADGLNSLNPDAPLPDQVNSWLFPAGITAHVILAASLRNPTVRLRYLAAREALEVHGYEELYPELLKLLGCAQLSPERIGHHLDALERTFDDAVESAKTPFFFSSDISPAARPIAIDGSRELIRSGNHREAVFWITATFARCHKILAADASPELHLEHVPSFQALLEDLGVGSTPALLRRAEDVGRFLPKLRDTAERILNQCCTDG